MGWALWVLGAYLFVAALTFVGLCRRLEPLDLEAFVTVGIMSIVWPLTLVKGS